ncbi:MAG: hypothetical protein JSS23_12250 [Proteobacteria bacterium]|nr:hypothetical protein [Pseudomonadota bacterium]
MIANPSISETVERGQFAPPPLQASLGFRRMRFVVERKEEESDGYRRVRCTLHLRPLEAQYQRTQDGYLRNERLPGENDNTWGRREPMGRLVLTAVLPEVAAQYAVNQVVFLDLVPTK